MIFAPPTGSHSPKQGTGYAFPVKVAFSEEEITPPDLATRRGISIKRLVLFRGSARNSGVTFHGSFPGNYCICIL